MSRRLRLFMTAFLGARVAEWVYLVALNWAVLQTTDSALYLALVNACRLLPGLVLSYPAGVLADRFERLRLYRLLTFLVSAMTPIVGLCLLWKAPFWLLASLLILRESLACMDPPIRQALLVDLARRDELSKALAWSATTMNLGRLLGPLLGGLLVSQTPIIVPFLVAAALTATQAVGLGRRLRGTPRSLDPQESVWSLLRTHPELRSLLTLTLPAMLFGFPYTAMMPLFARDLHHQGADGLGLYLSLAALGALLGSLWQTREGNQPHLAGWMLLFSAGLLLFVLARPAWLVYASLLLIGFAGQGFRTGSRILVQQSVPPQLQGRVMGLALMDRSLIPLGATLIAAVATWTSPLAAGIVMALGCLIGIGATRTRLRG